VEQSGVAKKSKTKRRLLAGISMNVLVLGIVSLLTDASSEMIYPIMPLFLSAIGATGLVIGLIEGASETTASFLKVVSGWYSDKFDRRKPFITGGYGLSTLMKPLLIWATTPLQVLGIRISERVGKGIRTAPRDALIADSTASDVRGKAFGFHKAMDSTGAVLGPVITLIIILIVVATEMKMFRLIFAIAVIPAVIAVLVILLFVREKEKSSKPVSTRTFRKGLKGLGRPFWLLMAVVVTFYIGEISYAFFILRAEDVNSNFFDRLVPSGVDPALVQAIVLYILYNVVFVVTAIPAGNLSDRLGRKPVIMAAFAIFVATGAAMAYSGHLAILAAGFILFGVYKGASEGVFKAYVTDVVPGDLKGTALGAFHTSVGLVMLPGGIIAGYLWDSVGHWATFAYGAVMAIIAMVMLFFLGLAKVDKVTRA
jgi:MFS family permease